MTTTRRLILVLAALLWSIALACGFYLINEYRQGPGSLGNTPDEWPGASAGPAPAVPTVLVFLHPHCPCSSATAEALDGAIAKAPAVGRARIRAVFLKPDGWTEAKVRGALWQRVAKIPGVAPEIDPAGAFANSFGALTSGTVLAYDGEGRLRFRGGITAGRGHQGENPGLAALTEFLSGKQKSESALARVFGCGLFGNGQRGAVN